MPRYDFECPIHGVFEKVLPMDRWDIDWVPCEASTEIKQGVYIPCAELAERLAPLTSMQPDKYWAGHVVHGNYITSKKQIPSELAPATRERLEYAAKRKDQLKKEFEEKSNANLKEYLTQELSGVNIEPDGTSVKERAKYERARGRDYTGSTE